MLEFADTGRGIAAAQIQRIFRPRPADEPALPNSYGIGLSSAIRLLAQVGGRLDVQSQPGFGSTFSAFFPLAPPGPKPGAAGEDMESIISQVVKVRKAS